MSIILQMAMFPTDKGDSVSPYVSRIIAMIRESGIPYSLSPMATIIETETLEEALKVINDAYKLLENDCSRVYATFSLDIRPGRQNRMDAKIKSVEDKIGKSTASD